MCNRVSEYFGGGSRALEGAMGEMEQLIAFFSMFQGEMVE